MKSWFMSMVLVVGSVSLGTTTAKLAISCEP